MQVQTLSSRTMYGNRNAAFTPGMRGIDEIRQANLRALIKRDFKTQAEFAEAMGYEPSLVSRLLSDNPETRQNIGKKMARLIEKKTRQPANWLDLPHDQLLIAQQSADYNVTPGPGVRGSVPVISWVQAGRWRELIDNLEAGDAERWIHTTAKVGPHAYALRIVGDSMTNPSAGPSFPENTVIIVDPDRQADPGRFVVVRQNHDEECTFKQLVRDGSRYYLKPLNPRYPILELAADAVICGVLVQATMEF